MISETLYKNGLKHGLEKSYRPNGSIYRETPYENGNRHGIEIFYSENMYMPRNII